MWDIQFICKTQQDPVGLQGLYSEAEKLKTSHQPDIASVEVMNTIKRVALVSHQVSRDHLDEACTHHGRVVDDVPHTFCQLLSSVEWCHQQGVFPGDVTLETLLYERELKVSRTGIGLTVEFAGYKLHTFRESPGSVAPRAFLQQEEEQPPIDVWSLGAVWSSVITGKEPFEGEVFWHSIRDFPGPAQRLDQGVLLFMSLREGNIWTSLKLMEGSNAWQEEGLNAWPQATHPMEMKKQ
ncbi:MAP/microtubule affinity-regulating kinase 3-like [Suricata suricatta]|uniref:MAP/microtubule affinity-regulating kinase 3-like n=1 Tax=Suricata suricatta TaxID=37032 RepID=UPI001155B50A|nr:MAP/microtubule affinity-regulating kinase 3-like [Suricata suricatta]